MPLNPPITDWRGRRVWLIGASSGIGRAVAALLHAHGAQVCVSARQQARLDDFVREHPGSQALALDVTDAQAVASAAQRLLAGGPLDLVCYCAGHYRPMSAHALDLPELLQHQSVNVTGALQVLAAKNSTRKITVLHADQEFSAWPLREQMLASIDALPQASISTWFERGELPEGLDAKAGYMDLTDSLTEGSQVYLCGPLPFMHAVRSQALAAGIPADRIHYEVFGPDVWLAA